MKANDNANKIGPYLAMLPKRLAWFGAQAHLVEIESPSGPVPLPDFPYQPLESETEKCVGNAFCERLESGLDLASVRPEDI